MNSEYILEFRSIDPARRYCASSDKQQFVHGFNQNSLNNADRNISTKSIDLLRSGFGNSKKISFLIKSYQRGFRWDAHENVRKLIDDLFSYSEEESTLFEKTRINYLQDFTEDDFDFYCLQTLTVKSTTDDDVWEVIDGQQRLTCIFLIYMVLSFFCGPVNTPYEIIYQREGKTFSLSKTIKKYFGELSNRSIQARDILQNDDLTEDERSEWFDKMIEDIESLFDKEKNIGGSYRIDSYYMRSAMVEAMKFVSEGKDQKQIETLLECIKRNVFFLWYVVPDDSGLSSEDVFLKINSGAIPLTNAELIKSLVLRSDNKDVKQKSHKWEEIERGLSKNELWSFVGGDFNSDTRIDLFLDVYARKISDKQNPYHGISINNPYALFDWYNEYSKSHKDFAADTLSGIQDIYDRITEWYDDVEIYHYIGLLTVYQKLGFRFSENLYKNQQEMLTCLLLEAEQVASKADFIGGLKNKILICLKDGLKKDQIPEETIFLVEDSDTYNNDFLNYNDDKKRVEAILWLLNIYETIESVDNKTEYEKKHFKYKNSICRRFPFSEALSGNWSLEHIFPQHPDDDDKEEIKKYEDIVKGLDERKRLKEDDVHSIKNLALLNKNLNTSLQNEMLNIKRSRLITEIGKGAFVPCATVNAFMLYYNIVVSDVAIEPENHQIGDDWNYWTVNDADNYENAIIECLKAMEGGKR